MSNDKMTLSARRLSLIQNHLQSLPSEVNPLTHQPTDSDPLFEKPTFRSSPSVRLSPTVSEIKNFFVEADPNFQCFGCSTHNPTSLGLKFYYDSNKDEVFSVFEATNSLSSFPHVVHGGILSVLIDDVAYWTFYQRFKKLAFTSKSEVKFLKVARPYKELIIRGKVYKQQKNEVEIRVRILDGETNDLLVEASIFFVIAKSPVFKKVFGKDVEKYLPYVEQDQ